MSTEIETADKRWTMKASDGVQISFLPVFVIKDKRDRNELQMYEQDKDVECTMFNIIVRDSKGRETTFDLGFQELFMLVYFCANEEIRQALQLRQEKHINYIPYEVTFKLDENEVRDRMAKRLIKLPIDELAMSIARSEAQLILGKANLEDMNTWFAKRKAQRSKH